MSLYNRESQRKACRKWYKKNRLKVIAKAIAWSKTKEGKAAKHRHHLSIRYGKGSYEWKESKLEKQNGKCAICKEYMQIPCLDHNHKTKKKRALLCHGCNILVACLENPLLRKAVRYLERHGDFNGFYPK